VKPIDELLAERFKVAIGLAFGAENIVDPLIKTADPRHADFQSNVAMSLAKRVSGKPRDVAEKIIQNVKLDDLCEAPTIAGPGFINLRLKKEFLAASLLSAIYDGRAGVERTAAAQTIAIDYSGPNVAKQMHVGHLRSTIIGDTLARAMEFLGHTVIRQNHIGDFGTQFGMLIHYLREQKLTDKPLTIADLDRLYKEATSRFKADPAFAEIARKTVVELQTGQASATEVWKPMRTATREHYTEIYAALGVTLTDAHERAESFFGPRLPKLIERVKQTLEPAGDNAAVIAHAGTADDADEDVTGNEGAGKAEEKRAAEAVEQEIPKVEKAFATYSQGAFCVFLPGWVNRDERPMPLMLQKRDGGYPYSATDLAALYFRVQENKTTPEEQKPLNRDWHADRVIYLTDARQSQHFAMLFDAFKAAQWDVLPAPLHEKATLADSGQDTLDSRIHAGLAPQKPRVASLEHAPFGSILGEDGKPFKTRSGDTVKLKELLEEAVVEAGKVKAERAAALSPEQRARVAKAVGIGAVKYADLKQDRTTDYIFTWDRLLSLEGNTGPYLQMAYTRVRSIYRKAGISADEVRAKRPALLLEHADEIALAKKLLAFGGVVESVARDLKPHYLCTYLYELAGAFSRFFESCPVLRAESEALKMSRLLLCDAVATTMRIGLTDLLGIETLEEM